MGRDLQLDELCVNTTPTDWHGFGWGKRRGESIEMEEGGGGKGGGRGNNDDTMGTTRWLQCCKEVEEQRRERERER